MRGIELVIDIGSKFITVGQRGRGVVLKEPALALLETRRRRLTLSESGKAVTRSGRLRDTQQIVAPVRGGVIAHEYAATLMLRDFIERIAPRRLLLRPRVKVLACISCGLTNTEKAQIEKVLVQAGAGEVVLLPSPVAVAASIDNTAHFVVDAGASKTEIAVVDGSGILAGCSLDIGGDTFNQAIIDYVTDTKRCRLPAAYAEKVKREVGSLYEQDTTALTMELKEIGTDRVYEYKITAKDVRLALEPLIAKIAEAVYHLSFQIPETIAQEIYLNGITLCGGSSYLPGFSEYLSAAMEMNVSVPEDATNAAVRGAMYFLEHPGKLSEVLNVDKFV